MGEKIQVNINVDVHCPMLPNYIRFNDGKTIHISQITEEELQKIGELWTRELIKKAKNGKI